ncbi:hypothetical protein MMC11_004372 [Xylographa trunciseda]|nr:hypothetical protein [Xylographa trunciseda]
MKSILSFCFQFILLTCLATVLATPLVQDSNSLAIPGLDERDAAAVQGPASLPVSAASAPRPEPPLGISGFWQDNDGIVWIYYAEDKLADHAEHIRLHFQMYPSHDTAYGIASDADKETHRKDALNGVPEKTGYARDEKMPASFNYPVGSTEVTVMYCDSRESKVEGGYSKNAKALALKGKKLLRIKDNRKDKTKGSPIKAKGFGTSTPITSGFITGRISPVPTPSVLASLSLSSLPTQSPIALAKSPSLSGGPALKKAKVEKRISEPNPNTPANGLRSRQPVDLNPDTLIHKRDANWRLHQLLQRGRAAAEAEAAMQLRAEHSRRDTWVEAGGYPTLGRRDARDDGYQYALDERDVFPRVLGISVFRGVVN